MVLADMIIALFDMAATVTGVAIDYILLLAIAILLHVYFHKHMSMRLIIYEISGPFRTKSKSVCSWEQQVR